MATSAAVLRPNDALTVSLWFRTSQTARAELFCNNGVDYFIRIAAPAVEFSRRSPAGGGAELTATGSAAGAFDGDWHHIAGVALARYSCRRTLARMTSWPGPLSRSPCQQGRQPSPCPSPASGRKRGGDRGQPSTVVDPVPSGPLSPACGRRFRERVADLSRSPVEPAAGNRQAGSASAYFVASAAAWIFRRAVTDRHQGSGFSMRAGSMASPRRGITRRAPRAGASCSSVSAGSSQA